MTTTHKTAGCTFDDIEQALLTAKAALQTNDEGVKQAAMADINHALQITECFRAQSPSN